MNLKKMMQGLVFFLTSLLVFVFLFRALLPTASPRMTKSKTAANDITYTYVALGDSLTKGIGDSTNQGGFVPLLAQSLSNENDGHYHAVNYGVAGNTSAQILDRLKKERGLQKDLKKARVMTLTVGGNDLRKIVVDHLSDFSLSDIQKPLKNYTANLKEIITRARKDNPQLPIYVVGIYNPLYLNFPELITIQKAVDQWNQTTEETIAPFDQVYFVPINDALYKGIDGKMGVSEVSDGKTTITNDALYEEDRFHPNNTGYEKMKQAILEKINETKKTWN